MNCAIVPLKIIWNSFCYRLVNREANNLITSLSVMIALHLDIKDIIYRFCYALILNVYVYLINDFFDVACDLASPERASSKTRYLADHRRSAQFAILFLGGVLLLGGLYHSWLMFIAFWANTFLVGSYSAKLKSCPFADIILMSLTGITMSLVSIPLQSFMGWKLIGLLGIICSSFEVIQIIRDEPHDRKAQVNTTAVKLGAKRAAWIFRGLILLASLYTIGLMQSWVGLGFLQGLLIPLNPQFASKAWDITRLIFGATWLGLIINVYLGII